MSFPTYPTFLKSPAALLADSSLTYDGERTAQATPGDRLTLQTGQAYDVAEPAATDHHLTTRGGVKLYIVSSSGSYLGVVATACRLPRNKDAAPSTQRSSRIQHFARAPMRGATFRYVNYYAPTLTASGGTMTLRAAIEYPVGTMTRLTFGGLDTAAVASGVHTTSDPLTIDIPDGARFREWTWIENAAGALYFTSADNVDLSAVGATVTDATGTGDTTGMTAGNKVYGATAIIGHTDKPSILILGDSRGAGSAATGRRNANDLGAVPIAISGAFGYTNLSVGGATLAQFAAAGANLTELAAYASHVVIHGGINDLNAGTTAATLEGHVNSIASAFNPNGDKPVYVTTVEPYTTSTDAWETEANQTIWDATKNTQRLSYNSTVRGGGLVGLWGIIDVAAMVESTASPGKWAVPDLTDDGLHANRRGDFLASRAVNPAVFGSKAYSAG